MLLEAHGIAKSFPGVRALDGVNLTVRRGRRNALLGENGAGKSTLMNILAGVFPPDTGTVTLAGRAVSFKSTREAQVAGKPVSIRSPRDAIAAGLALAPKDRKAEGVVLGLSVATTSTHRRIRIRKDKIEGLIKNYGKVKKAIWTNTPMDFRAWIIGCL